MHAPENSTRKPGWIAWTAGGQFFAGVALVLYAVWRYGAATSYDSAAYFQCAESLAAGKGFVGLSGAHYVLWPPLYPIVLTLAPLTGAPPAMFAGMVGAVSHGLTSVFVFLMIARVVERRWLAVACGIATVLAWPLFIIATLALTESLFVMLLTGSFFWFLLDRDHPGGWGYWALCTVFGALAALTRYTGVSVIAAISLAYGAAAVRDRSRREAIKAAGHAALASLPLGVWLIRNLVLYGTLTGHTASSQHTPMLFIEQSVQTLIGWFTPVVTLWALGLPVLLWFARLEWAKLRPPVRIFGHAAALFAMLYILLLLYGALAQSIDPISDRFLGPMFPPLLVVFAIAANLVLDRLQPTRWSLAAAIAVGFMLLAPGTKAPVEAWRKHVQGAGGFSTQSYAESAIAQLAPKLAAEPLPLLTNSAPALYLMTGIALPSRGSLPVANPEKLQRRYSDEPAGSQAILVWIGGLALSDEGYLDELRPFMELDLRAEFPDGSRIYLVTFKGADADAR